MKLLISFCNSEPSGQTNVAKVDVDTREVEWLTVTGDGRGVTGLCLYGDLLYYFNQTGSIGVFDVAKNTLLSEQNIKARDPHSLLRKGNDLFFVNTGRDRVARLELKDDITFGNRHLVWDASGAGADKNHVNCLAVNDKGHVFASFFGPKRDGSSWASADEGGVMNVTLKVRLPLDFLYHPHSIKFWKDELFICDSNNRSLKKGNEVLKDFKHGYVRGLDIYGGIIAVGFSDNRRVSKSTGQVNQVVSETPICEVRLLKEDSLDEFWSMDFTQFKKKEVYDIIILP